MPGISESEAKNHAIRELGKKKFDAAEMILVNKNDGSIHCGILDSETIKTLGEVYYVKGKEVKTKKADGNNNDKS